MTAETDEADRLLNRAMVALFNSAKLGNNHARHLYLIAPGRRSPGRPPHDDAADLAAIQAGETLSAVAARQSAVTDATPGPVFRPMLKGSLVLDEPLSGHSAAAIVKRYAKDRFPPSDRTAVIFR